MTDETISPRSDAAPTPDPQHAAAPVAPAPEPPAATPAVEESMLAAPAEPSAYEAFRLPDGVTVDAEQLAEASELFRSASLSQEQAQKFVDLAVARETQAAQRGLRAFVDLQNKWVSEIKADPELGGERLQASIASARRAIDRLDVPGLREALNLTGAGNHPAVVKAFVRLGQMIAEDRFRPGKDAVPAAPRSLAEVIYDGQPKTPE